VIKTLGKSLPRKATPRCRLRLAWGKRGDIKNIGNLIFINFSVDATYEWLQED